MAEQDDLIARLDTDIKRACAAFSPAPTAATHCASCGEPAHRHLIREARAALVAQQTERDRETAHMEGAFRLWRESFKDLIEDRDEKKHALRKVTERAEQAEARLREAEARVAVLRNADNHHNALACPYCNPKGLDPAATDEALARLKQENMDLRIAASDTWQQLVYWWNETGRCPCGARRESPWTHPHVGGCPTEAALLAGEAKGLVSGLSDFTAGTTPVRR